MRNRYYGFDTANKFVDFHPFPLSIDKNHLIAINFYRCPLNWGSAYYISGFTVITGLKSDAILSVADRNVAIFTTWHAITRYEFQVS